MKNKGFTLSEILIAIAIIGVIAAVTLSTVNNILPDRDKADVLKVYKTLNDINGEIFNNPTLYMYDNGGNCSQNILQCTSKPLDSDTNAAHNSTNFEGLDKYPYLLAENMVLSKDISKASSDYNFTTTDGIEWTLTAQSEQTNPQIPQSYTVTIDTGNPHRQAGLYSGTNQNPRQFKFIVSANGSVTASDALSQAYLKNPNDLSDRVADLKVAKDIYTHSPLPTLGSSQVKPQAQEKDSSEPGSSPAVPGKENESSQGEDLKGNAAMSSGSGSSSAVTGKSGSKSGVQTNAD